MLKKNQEVVIISSGAVAKGMHEMSMKERPSSLHLLQACAAVGQRGLIQIYQSEFDVLVIITTVLLYFDNLIFLFFIPYLSNKS